MCKKSCILVSLVLLLGMSAISSAATINWSNGASPVDGDWNNTANWTGGVKPNTTTDLAKVLMAAGPVFSTGRTATAYRVYLDGTNGSITMDGGTLNTNGFLGIAYNASTDSGTLTVNSGTITIAAGALNNLLCGVKGTGTINMSGGAINLPGSTFFIARDPGSTGTVNLSGGTITCGTLSMRANSTTANGTINITGTGTLIITTTGATNVSTYVTNGWIKAYNGGGTVVVDVNNINPGKTTVTGLAPTKAGSPSPANNATNVSTLADFSWSGMLEATSHDVYLGTVSPGTFQGNTTGLTFDPGALAPNTRYYWRIDEKAGDEVISTGDVWTFVTGTNIATRPNPANGATNCSVTGSLSWTPSMIATSHDVHFGTTNPPALIGNQDVNNFSPGILAVDTTYYWRIDEVRDAIVYEGTVWSFTTQSAIKKGPYLIYPGNNTQMTVLWQVPLTQSCTLAWGLDTSYSTGSTSTTEYGTDHQHKYTITGLTPGTKYYYRVTTPLIVTTGSFQTAPAADAATVKFMVYGDTRTNAASHNSVAAAVNSTYAGDSEYQTMMLLSGDWVNSDDESNWTDEYFNRGQSSALQMQANIPIIGCMGNHETMGAGMTVYDKYWPYPYIAPTSGRYWSFDYGPAHIVILDQYVSYLPGSAQYTWLVNDLATSTKKWKMIVLHQPGWCAGGSHGNDATVQTHIQPLCETYGVQVVFAGHNHYYSRAVVNGVHHVTTGSGGAPFYAATAGQPNVVTYTVNKLEFCKVNITSDTMGVQTVTDTGAVIDTFFVNTVEPDLTFVQVTDPQIGWSNCGNMDYMWEKTVNKINAVKPAFAVVTGDLVDNRGISSQVTVYKAGAAQLKAGIPMYQLPGNHDVGDAPDTTSYAFWQNNFTSSGNSNPWFSFTYGDTLFICLDSMVLKTPTNLPDKATEEMAWLTAELQRTGFTHKIVFMHIPLCRTSISEPEDGFNMPTSNGLRQQLLSLFHTNGVNAVFSGHAHYNSYAVDGDLEIVTTSSSNCSLGSPSTPQGFRIVKIYPDHIEHTYRSLDSMASLKGDFNGDGTVDIRDMDIFSGHWLENNIWP